MRGVLTPRRRACVLQAPCLSLSPAAPACLPTHPTSIFVHQQRKERRVLTNSITAHMPFPGIGTPPWLSAAGAKCGTSAAALLPLIPPFHPPTPRLTRRWCAAPTACHQPPSSSFPALCACLGPALGITVWFGDGLSDCLMWRDDGDGDDPGALCTTVSLLVSSASLFSTRHDHPTKTDATVWITWPVSSFFQGALNRRLRPNTDLQSFTAEGFWHARWHAAEGQTFKAGRRAA